MSCSLSEWPTIVQAPREIPEEVVAHDCCSSANLSWGPFSECVSITGHLASRFSVGTGLTVYMLLLLSSHYPQSIKVLSLIFLECPFSVKLPITDSELPLYFYFFNWLSKASGWHHICYLAERDVNLLVLLPPPLSCWDYSLEICFVWGSSDHIQAVIYVN